MDVKQLNEMFKEEYPDVKPKDMARDVLAKSVVYVAELERLLEAYKGVRDTVPNFDCDGSEIYEKIKTVKEGRDAAFRVLCGTATEDEEELYKLYVYTDFC